MWKIIYTHHLEFRLKARKIPHELPRRIFRQAIEHYYDNSTKHYIAIHQVEYRGRIREMVLTYDKEEDIVELITIHPIKYSAASR